MDRGRGRPRVNGRTIDPIPASLLGIDASLEIKKPFNKTLGLELHRALLIVALRMREVGQLPADALKDYAAKCVKPTQVHLSNPEHWHSVLVLARVIQEATPHKTLSSSPVPVPVVGTLRRPVGEHATGPPPSTPQAPSVPLPPGLRVGDSKLCLVDELPMKRLEDGDFHHVTHADQAHHDRLTRYRSAQNHVFQGATP